MAKPRNPTREPLLKRPYTLHPIGHLSDFPNRVELGRRTTSDRPGAEEDMTADPVVYLQVATYGRKPLSDLFYLVHDERRRNGIRVYFQEVVIPDA